MHYLNRVVGIVALCVIPMVGCGDDPCEGVRCIDSNECTIGRCVGGACEFEPVEDGAQCNDDEECTAADVCTDGVCEGTPVEDGTACSADPNECTIEMCANGTCGSTPVEDGTACEDDDGNGCTVGECASGGCESIPVEDGTACEDDDGNECSAGQCASGACEVTLVANGTACGDDAGTCRDGSCEMVCTEQGIRDAIAVGGGPYTLDCDGAQTVVTRAEIIIDRNVILDGEGNLTVDGNDSHRLFNVQPGVAATVKALTLTRGYIHGGNGGAVSNGGALNLDHCTISGNTARNSSGLSRGHGGGIYNTGRLTLEDSAVLGNRAIPSCPTDCNICICTGGWGDGIANEGGTVTLINSLVDEVTSWAGGTLTQTFTGFAQDFESLDKTSPTALSDYGWLIWGQVVDANDDFKFGYGPYPAPNGGPAFSAVVSDEGGPDQGAQQLLVHNDYNCCDSPNQGHFNGTDRVTSLVYQEPFAQDNPISVNDVGKTLELSFDAKRGDINDPTGSSTAAAFIQTVDPNAGFAQTNFVSVDMTNLPTGIWDRYSVSLAIDAGLVDQHLDFGFSSTASNFEPSGVFYDNILVTLEAP